MLLDVDTASATYDHHCAHCGLVRRGLRIHPQHGDLVAFHDAMSGPQIQTPPCPQCKSVECFRVDIAPHEAGEGLHPLSLVGTRFPDTGGVVTEHDIDGSSHPVHRQQAQRILALVRHPHLADHLKPTPTP